MVSKAGFSMAGVAAGKNNLSNLLNLKAFVTIARAVGVISGKLHKCLNVARFHHLTKMCCTA
jgi:hypothetical protein